jgi:hypothetical protein
MSVAAFFFLAGLCGFGDFVGLGGLLLEEAEGGVALAEEAGLQEAADALGQIESAAVLGDYEAALTEKWRGAEEAEDAVVLIFFGVGGIDENETEWSVGGLVAGGDFLERPKSVEGEDMGTAGDCEGFEVAADESGSGGVVFDEDGFDGAAAQSFDSNGAGTGEDVEEARTADVGTENVEEGFAQAVAGGAESVALEVFENAAAVFAGDDAHCCLADFRQMVAALPFGGKSAEDAIEGGLLRGRVGDGEGFAAGLL